MEFFFKRLKKNQKNHTHAHTRREREENAVNPLPDMPILSSSISAASTDMMSKIWTNGDTII